MDTQLFRSRLKHLRIAVATCALQVAALLVAGLLTTGLPAFAQAAPGQAPGRADIPVNTIQARADAPLTVTQDSRVVLMEYEAWFGPDAVTFQNSAAIPLLQSADMQSIGGGYDSADPAVIRQHVAWMEQMGINGVIVDLTNAVSCIFNSEWFIKKYLTHAPGDCPVYRTAYQNIRDNTGNLYPAWARIGTPLKLVPLLGGIDQNVLYKDTDGETAFEKEIKYFGALMANTRPARLSTRGSR